MTFPDNQDIEKIVSSISKGIDHVPFIADASAIFSCPYVHLNRDYSKNNGDLAEKQALYFERMLGVLGLDNMIIPPGVKGELVSLFYYMRSNLDHPKDPSLERLVRSAEMMHRLVCHKKTYAQTKDFEGLKKEVDKLRPSVLNYDGKPCSSEDVLAITSALDLALVNGPQAGLVSKDGYMVELMAKSARYTKIPLQLLTFELSKGVYTPRDYAKLGRWDPCKKVFSKRE